MMFQPHVMILKNTHPSSAEEWFCPTCGRRLIMDYGSRFKKTVLEAGNETAIHSGGKRPLQIISKPVMSKKKLTHESSMSIEDQRLAPWLAWMERVGFEDLWSKDSK
jgi:hypothetical protein